MVAIAAIMSEYSRGILDLISDPRTGVVRRIKFLPRPAEIAEACDTEVARRKTLRRNAAHIMWRRHRSDQLDAATMAKMTAKVGL
jgi:hypothetical protein